jgi:hypothetical protein
MLKFTYLLQHCIRHRLPYARLVVMHVVSLFMFVPIMIGVLLFLSEFFGDHMLAFGLLSTVWLGEVYSVIGLRTPTSTRVFPHIFCFGFVIFNLYCFIFPHGFKNLALITVGQ